LIRADATGTSETLTFASCCEPTLPRTGLGWVQSESAVLQPCLDVDETRRETSGAVLASTSN